LPPLQPPGRAALARAWEDQRIALVALGVLGVLAILVFATLGERVVHRDRVLPGVEAGGVDLGGMTEPEALAALQRTSHDLRSRPVTLTVGGQTLSVDPTAMGLEVDARATVRAAREAGRGDNPADQILGAALRRMRPDEVPLVVSFDEGRFAGVLDGWVAATGKGLVDGGLRFEGTQVVEIAPKAGTGIQRESTRARIVAALESGRSDAGTVAIGPTTPAVDQADVSRAAARARRLLASPVTVQVSGFPLVLTPEQVAPTLSTAIVDSRLDLVVDPTALRVALGAPLASLETAPKNADFAISGTAVSVVPAVIGKQADLDQVAGRIASGQHRVTAPFHDVAPERSTEWAQKLNITELVSSFTTRYPSGQPRVTNIHRGADVINGTIIEPGQTFSLNQALGQRTLDKGYVEAPQIGADLSYEDSVGGGVSQLSTTLYNAVFFGCYEDVTHTVHALYISRYPMGREATLNYPSIDNQFRNDSGSGILLRAYYSSTSVTVALFGNREGRSCRAEGPNVLQTIPSEVEYVDDPALPVGQQKQIEAGHTGYVVENFRIISRPGQPDKRERYVERYSMSKTKVARGTGGAPPTAPPAAPPPG
jgi:vancomycin resistance protein YoaR